MKIWRISREKIAQKIEQNKLKRIEEYTKVSTAFKPEDSAIIRENLDSIARNAKRNNCNLEFVPSKRILGAPKMRVLDRTAESSGYTQGDTLKGEVLLPAHMGTKEEVLNAIKTNAAKILYGEK